MENLKEISCGPTITANDISDDDEVLFFDVPKNVIFKKFVAVNYLIKLTFLFMFNNIF